MPFANDDILCLQCATRRGRIFAQLYLALLEPSESFLTNTSPHRQRLPDPR